MIVDNRYSARACMQIRRWLDRRLMTRDPPQQLIWVSTRPNLTWDGDRLSPSAAPVMGRRLLQDPARRRPRPRSARTEDGYGRLPISHVHFNVSMWGPYLPNLGRLDRSRPHTSGFGDGGLASKASLLVWDARRSNLSGAASFTNQGEDKSTGDPWTVIQRQIKKNCGQPIPSYEQILIATELLERVMKPWVEADLISRHIVVDFEGL